MGDEEPAADAPPAEEEAPAEAAAAPTVEEVKALAPNDAWEKYPALKEAYEAAEDKEGILAQAEAEEGEEAPPPGWGEKADEWLGANADKFAAAAGEPPPKELKKVVTTREQWLAAEVKLRGMEGKEAQVEKEWGYAAEHAESKNKLDLLTKSQLAAVLDACNPVDVASLGVTNKDWYKRVGKPRTVKNKVVWNKVKDYYAWEKAMGGPVWHTDVTGARWRAAKKAFTVMKAGGAGFARAALMMKSMRAKRGMNTVLDEKFDDLLEQLGKQSEEGRDKLEYTVEMPVAVNCEGKVGRKISERCLSQKLYNAGITGFEITGEGGEFIVGIPVAIEDQVDKSLAALEWLLPIQDLMRDLVNAQQALGAAMVTAQSIRERGAKLEENMPGVGAGDAAEPLVALRESAQEPLKALRTNVDAIKKAVNDGIFAERVFGDLFPGGGQRGYRVAAARSLRHWAEAQHRAATKALCDGFADQLMSSASEAGNASATCTITLPVLKTAEGPVAPQYLGFAGSLRVLSAVIAHVVKDVALGVDTSAALQGDGDEGGDSASWEVSAPLGTTPAA